MKLKKYIPLLALLLMSLPGVSVAQYGYDLYNNPSTSPILPPEGYGNSLVPGGYVYPYDRNVEFYGYYPPTGAGYEYSWYGLFTRPDLPPEGYGNSLVPGGYVYNPANSVTNRNRYSTSPGGVTVDNRDQTQYLNRNRGFSSSIQDPFR
jgi:hypothetical protein